MMDDPLKVKTEGLIENRWSNYFEYVWNIKNFSLIEAKFESPEFQVEVLGDLTKWKLVLFPAVVEYCCVFLVAVHVKLNCALSECEFTLLNSRGSKIISRSFKHNDFDVESWGYPELIKRDEVLNNISHDDNLRIISKMLLSNSWNPIPHFKSSIVYDLDKVRNDGNFSDVTFSVKNSKFYAHKFVLAARSPVFAAMFKHEMKEAKSGEVEIDDMEPKVFEAFLKFIYTGDLVIECSGDLLAASDKYDLEELKMFCEEALIKDLSHENCIKTLILADLHNAEKLKNETIYFIIFRGPKLDKNRLAEIDNVSLLKELIEAFSVKFSENKTGNEDPSKELKN